MVNFCKIGDRKVVTDRVSILKVNPKIDIVALALSNGEVHLYRLIIWQRVWAIPVPKNLKLAEDDNTDLVIDMDWSPHGKLLSILYRGAVSETNNRHQASTNGNCESQSTYYSYDINSNELLFSRSFSYMASSLGWSAWQHYDEENVLTLNVLDESDETIPLDALEIPCIDMFNDEIQFERQVGMNIRLDDQGGETVKDRKRTPATSLFAPIDGNPSSRRRGTSNNAVIDFQSYDQLSVYPRGHVYLLLVTGRNHCIDIFAYGVFQLFSIQLNNLSPLDASHQISSVWLSNDLKLLTCLVASNLSNQEPNDSNSPKLVSFELDFLAARFREVYIGIKIMSAIGARLRFLDEILLDMHGVWEDLMAEVDSKLSNYIDRQEKTNDNEDDNQIDIENEEQPMRALNEAAKRKTDKTPLEPGDFIDMLVFGEMSCSIEQFLVHLTEKGLKNLAQTITSSFEKLHSLNIEHVQRTLMHLFIFCQRLRAFIVADVQFGQLGLSIGDTNRMIREASAMLLKSMQMQQVLIDSMKKTEAFVRWLQKMMFYQFHSFEKESMENYMEILTNTGSCLQVSQQDVLLLMEFFQENAISSGFKFEAVAHFLRKSTNIANLTLEAKPSTAYRETMEEKRLDGFVDKLVKHFKNDAQSRERWQTASNEINQEFVNIFFESNVFEDFVDPIFQRKPEDWLDKLLLSDEFDLDVFDPELYKNHSLFDHFRSILSLQEKSFECASKRLAYAQLVKLCQDCKLTDNSTNEDRNRSNFFEMNLAPRKLKHIRDLSQEADYFCLNRQDEPLEHYWLSVSPQADCLWLVQSIQSAKRRGFTLRFVSSCRRPCACVGSRAVAYSIKAATFYNPVFLTLALDEQHPQAMDAKDRWQHLVQFDYRSFLQILGADQSWPAGAEVEDRKPVLIVGLDYPLAQADLEESMELGSKQIDPATLEPDEHYFTGTSSIVIRSWKIKKTEVMTDRQGDTAFKIADYAERLDVSGPRNVACLSNATRTKIAVFEMNNDEMEHDDDDEDEADDEDKSGLIADDMEQVDDDGFVMVKMEDE